MLYFLRPLYLCIGLPDDEMQASGYKYIWQTHTNHSKRRIAYETL